MRKEILTFGNIEIEKKKIIIIRLIFFKGCRYCEIISI